MKVWIYLFVFFILQLPVAAQQDNPFDLYRPADTTQQIDRNEATEPESPAEQTKIEGENPFTVSHIPIRKNQIQQIENLSFLEEESNQETLDISYMPLWILIFSLCLLAIMIYLKKDHFYILLRSLFNENFMRLTQYEQGKSRNPIYLLGYFLLIMNLGLFIHLILVHIFATHIDHQYLYILGFLLVFLPGKHLVNAFFGYVFYVEKERALYDFTIITFYNTLSVIFLVINVLFVFGPDGWNKALAVSGIFIYILALTARYYKGFHIGRYYVSHYFLHFFVYFCALEISPWVLVYTLVKDLLIIN